MPCGQASWSEPGSLEHSGSGARRLSRALSALLCLLHSAAGAAQAVAAHPQYLALLQRVRVLAPTTQPRALANTLWGLAGAQGDGVWRGPLAATRQGRGGEEMGTCGGKAQALAARACVHSATSVPAPPPPPAALGDLENLEVAGVLAERVAQHPTSTYQPQELSNVVWALGTLGLLVEGTLDHLLAGVTEQVGGGGRCVAGGGRVMACS